MGARGRGVPVSTPPTASAGPDHIFVEQTSPDGAVVSLDGSGSSDPEGDQLTYSWYAGGEEIATGVSPNVELGPGETIVTLIVNDGVWDAEATITVTVKDTTAPDLVVPDDVTVEQDGPGGTVVELTAVATDACDPDVEVVSDAPALYLCGETIVTFTATDSNGNVSWDTVLVTVLDTTAPVLTLEYPAEAPDLWPPNHRFVEVLTGSAFDTCDVGLALAVDISVIDSAGGAGKD